MLLGCTAVCALGFGGRLAWKALTDHPIAPLPAVSAPPPPGSRLPAALLDPPTSREGFDLAQALAGTFDPDAPARLALAGGPGASGARPGPPSEARAASTERALGTDGAIRVEYSLNETLTGEVFEILRRGRVSRGHALVIDPRSGRLLVYASTDPETFPAKAAYPAASIVKVLTAAAMLEAGDEGADLSCVYRGNKYRLNRRRLDRPRSGNRSDLGDALATSNNQCFSQWTLHVLGEERLRSAFERFGWLAPPARGHPPGRIELVESRLDLGRLGSGLDGLRVTPLHVAALTSILTDGVLREPWWVDRAVDGTGRSLPLPPQAAPRRVLSAARADELRDMMVATTTRGTAKSAFRTRRGGRVLGDVRVAGKTGNLTGRDPFGRYEWFVGLAPADDPKIGVVVLQLQSNLWWKKSTELAADILREVFCEKRRCSAALAARWTGDLGAEVVPRTLSTLEDPLRIARTMPDDETIRR